jgi:hypothetical protein
MYTETDSRLDPKVKVLKNERGKETNQGQGTQTKQTEVCAMWVIKSNNTETADFSKLRSVQGGIAETARPSIATPRGLIRRIPPHA